MPTTNAFEAAIRFTLLCPQCRGLCMAAFCHEETCRRPFLPLPGYSRTFCPLHDPVDLVAAFRARRMRDVVHCPSCDANLFGVKPGDGPRSPFP